MTDYIRIDNHPLPAEGEPKPEMTSDDVLDFYNELKSLGIDIWIDGGWGVDALLSRQSRQHKDLDIAIESKDVPKMRELLEARGYRDIKLDEAKPHNFVLADNYGHEIDVHVIVLDQKGNGIYGPAENGEMYPAEGLSGIGFIDEKEVKCISPEVMVKFHSGYELKEKDYLDVSAICNKYGIELPKEYEKFLK